MMQDILFDYDTFKSDDRFKGYTLLEKPAPFKDLFSGTDFSSVDVMMCSKDFEHVGYVGSFVYIDNKVTPLHGHIYSDKMVVYAYEESIFNASGFNGLVVVTNTF